ncbi:cytochrome P450 1A4-like [Monodon monoceros]|uniref:cytochrome P450 1A4-like n=1 Tax=Monodon monoceros TaxID=40151 RepID=UPI0010F8DA88|nr:cytochrome P450 1A4-like [Monodon monoceros]
MGIQKCLREDVARNEIFIFITTVLQQLKLEKCPEAELDLTPMYGLAMKPTPYQLQVETHSTEFFSLKESVLKKQDVLSTHIPRIPFWSEVSC